MEKLSRDMPGERESHNKLILLIKKAGFKVPLTNDVTGFRIGHIEVMNPKPNHPTNHGKTYEDMCLPDRLRPVGYIGYNSLCLLHTNESALEEYHKKLREVACF